MRRPLSSSITKTFKALQPKSNEFRHQTQISHSRSLTQTSHPRTQAQPRTSSSYRDQELEECLRHFHKSNQNRGNGLPVECYKTTRSKDLEQLIPTHHITRLEGKQIPDNRHLNRQYSDGNLESNQISKDHYLEDSSNHSFLDDNYSDARILNDSHPTSDSLFRKIHSRLLFSGSERPFNSRSIFDGRSYDQRGIEQGLADEKAFLEQIEEERRERERTVLVMDVKREIRRAVLSEGFERERAVGGLSGLLMRDEEAGGRKLLSGEEGDFMSAGGGGGGGKWRLTSDGKGLERSFKFKTFKTTWEFMTRIATECEAQKHYPHWANIYNTIFIRWTTHSPPGISESDILMAQFCTSLAAEMNELPPPPLPEDECLIPPSPTTQPLPNTTPEPKVQKWTLSPDLQALERTFQFQRFDAAWKFMTKIATECKLQKHHPEWSNIYNKTFIRWKTHSPPGLSEKDIHMARFCNNITEKITKLPSEESIQKGKELADFVARVGKDCCVPSANRKVVGGDVLGEREARLDKDVLSKETKTSDMVDSGFEGVMMVYKGTEAYKERERLIEEDSKRQRVKREEEGRFPAAKAVEQAGVWLENKDLLWGVKVKGEEDIYQGRREEEGRIGHDDGHGEDGQSD